MKSTGFRFQRPGLVPTCLPPSVAWDQMRSRIGKHWANSEVLYIEVIVPFDHDYEARGRQWWARPCLRVSRNQADIADQERPCPHRCCQCHALAALQTLDTWDKKGHARCKGHGARGLTRDLLLRRAAGRKEFSPTVYHPQWKCWVPTQPSILAHIPFGPWDF